ncbi:MAG: flagellar filament capping protein FliD [Muribaculaceae bacterium]|nr:flagellar filament capping protein FliD [Roseburia sp.]MCM1429825.1 flagellar filament capping protein FliD [Muribaculaceae bacterium]MCM1492876.1 flagellar filament capping protein FliD [Muribaculaceae bacterium]
MARIDSAYAYYMSTYANKEVSRYDSHKKSELRKVYNRIVKANKDSPLYKIAHPSSAKRYAIDIKENAKSIQNVVASLSDRYGTIENSFQKKVAVSSDEDKVGVTYIGDGNEENPADHFAISVEQLATPQTNIGHYLPNNELSIRPGAYSFDLSVSSSAYEFQFSVSESETNLDIIQKLARLVNQSNLGITADVLSDGQETSALALTSVQTGLGEGEEQLFSISPDASSGSLETMKLLGINQVAEKAHNSSFTLNGVAHTSMSNTFTLNNIFELTLREPTDGQTATIGFKPNTDAIADNIQTMVDAYNRILTVAESYSKREGSRLFNDISALARHNQIALEYVGLMVGDDGDLSIDRDVLARSVEPDRAENTFAALSRFRDTLGVKAENVAIDPMHYVNKVIVAYKNPGHNFATPYISSIYSGMMLDSYI